MSPSTKTVTVDSLRAALVAVEESKLCRDCLADACAVHDEMPDPAIGCDDAEAIFEAIE